MKNRVIGKIIGEGVGPLMILVGGLHGNESAGINAIQSIFNTLTQRKIPLNGTIIGIKGNIQAISQNQRYVEYDLNRCWNENFIKDISNPQKEKLAEDLEALEIHQIINSIDENNYSKKILVDLHTTSSDNGNFIVIPGDEAGNSIVKALKLPIIIDLDQYLEGTLMQFMHAKGYLAFAFEGGLIGSDRALQLHTAGIWELLKASKMIDIHHLNDLTSYDKIIEQFASRLPHMVKVLYRHWVNDADHFKMSPGFHNFQPIEKGQVLATDKYGTIRAKCDGLMFMPLYQNKGNEGFFIVEEVFVHDVT